MKDHDYVTVSIPNLLSLSEQGFTTGLELCGVGKHHFEPLCLAALSLLDLGSARSIRSCWFTRAWAGVSSLPAVHSPYTAADVRKPAEPWSPEMCVARLSAWLDGAVPKDILNAELPPRQMYLHVPQSGAEWPTAPPMANGAPNESRGSEYLYHRGFVIRSRYHALTVIPVWARWGPFQNETQE